MLRETWTERRLALLKRLWGAGVTAQTIADRLGVSRAAVMGKIFRLRLRADTAGAAEASARPARRHRGKRGELPKRGAPAPNPAPRRQGKSLLELTNETCRWPHGRPGTANFFFCGAPGAALDRGMPYCEHHARRACGGVPGRDGSEKYTADEAGDAAPDCPWAAPPCRQWRAAMRRPAARGS